jgi:hypothetical protein
MKQYDYLNGWWHLLPNICLLAAIIGQFNSTYSPSLTWNRILIAPQAIDWKTKKIPLRSQAPQPSVPKLISQN